ncbi:EDD domain protein, DegV family [Ignavigranum ruoffiae]|uniref:EDD domain protein, DegV family n=1 Tax=Ignavigranum ruoffiae TaxID=89093 RepID=A0A1H9DIK3_9LACT|nr:DegV family protein [Ignavigranum ruoffiae]SEQ13249.1 EDD domain protein, DegV family [Ignavigranum ruoffiae]
MKLAIIVDSTAGLVPPLSTYPDLFQVNLWINFADGQSMVDSVDGAKNKGFYQRLAQAEELPSTSQPQIGEYYTLMDQIVEEGYDAVIAFHLSGKISGTSASAQLVMQDYADKLKTYVVDSKSASVAVLGMVRQCIALHERGYSFEQLTQAMESLVVRTKVYFMVQDLNNLTKGGRLSATGAMLGNVLKIRPILTFNPAGEMVVHDKIRTTKKVYQEFQTWAEDLVKECPEGYDIAIVHTDAYDEATELHQQFEQKFGAEHLLSIGWASPVLGTHTGKGLVGFGVLPHIE